MTLTLTKIIWIKLCNAQYSPANDALQHTDYGGNWSGSSDFLQIWNYFLQLFTWEMEEIRGILLFTLIIIGGNLKGCTLILQVNWKSTHNILQDWESKFIQNGTPISSDFGGYRRIFLLLPPISGGYRRTPPISSEIWLHRKWFGALQHATAFTPTHI